MRTEGGNGPRLDHPAGSVLPNNRTRCGTIELPIMTMTGGWEECGQREEINPTDERGKHLETSKEDVQPPSVRKYKQYFNGIQNEGNQPSSISAPRHPYQLWLSDSAGYYGITGNAGDGDHGKERQKPKTYPEHLRLPKPPVTTEGGNGPRPDHPRGSVLQSHHISPKRDRTNELPIKEGKHFYFSMENAKPPPSPLRPPPPWKWGDCEEAKGKFV